MNNKKMKILVVDDERALASALSLRLKKAGYDVSTVFNGEEALATLKKSPFDLVLLDLLMPGVDGWGVLTSMKGSNVPIIITSNLSQEEDRQKAIALGALDFIIKSNATLSEIADKVDATLKKLSKVKK